MPESRLSDMYEEVASGTLRVLEGGSGNAVLVLHGMASDADAWRERAEQLPAAGLRALVPDRRGYGGSPAPEPYGATTVVEQAQDAVALLTAREAAPAIVAGDGFGALIALDLALRHPELVRGLALANPPLLQFLPEGADWLLATQAQLRAALETGGPSAAIDLWLGGRVSGAELARAQTAYRAFFADYAGLTSLELTTGQLKALTIPVVVTVVTGAPPHIAVGAERLAQLVPGVQRRTDGDLIAAARSIA